MSSNGWRRTSVATRMRALFVVSALILVAASSPRALSSPAAPVVSAPARAEILWDSWGVPHIFAKGDVGLFRAFGWAQMTNHANVLLRLYGQARGRGAEYWGAGYLTADRTVRLFDFPHRAQTWYAALSPAFKTYVTAFAAGINAYARAHPDRIAPTVRVVLPIRPEDVLAHMLRVFYVFIASNAGCTAAAPMGTAFGSNGWAISPTRAAGGAAMLLANPHLPWQDLFTWMEAQLTGPDITVYGAAFIGFPVLGIAFNDVLGWTMTVNTHDGCDLYQLTLSGSGYRFDGKVLPFATRAVVLKVRQSDGAVRSQTLVVRRAVQGPVVERGGRSLAVRIVGVDQFAAYGLLQEWWDLARATNLALFQRVLARLQLPMFTVLYADRDGHIMSVFNGQVPVRRHGDWTYWSGIVPGDTSRTLWTRLYPYQALPRVVDPPSGWVQNANSPPWLTTYPAVLDPRRYPAALAPWYVSLREQRGIEMLRQSGQLSFAHLIQDTFSARIALADRVLGDLVVAARRHGSPLAKRAAAVLVHWDRAANATSRGTVLFYFWEQAMVQQSGDFSAIFATPQDAGHPLTTPRGVASPQVAADALDSAARQLQAMGVRLDVPWGHLFRMRQGRVDLPAQGGPGDPWGCFRALDFAQDAAGRYQATGGDGFILVVAFTRPLQARVLLTYGNASQPGSPHVGDQLLLYARNQLRPVWRTRADVMAHLASRDMV